MLQIYSTKCAGKKVQIFLREMEGALQGVLQRGGELQAGLCRKDAEFRQPRRTLALGKAEFRRGGSGSIDVPRAEGLLGLRTPVRPRARPQHGALLGLIRGFAAFIQAGVGDIPVGGFFVLCLPFVLHPAILEPHFDLPLGQVEQSSDFHPTGPAEVFIEVEFFLQLQELRVGVRCPEPPRSAAVCQPLRVLNTQNSTLQGGRGAKVRMEPSPPNTGRAQRAPTVPTGGRWGWGAATKENKCLMAFFQWG